MGSLKVNANEGTGVFASNSNNSKGLSDQGERVLLADMEVRLGSLDSEIRSLRGDIERIFYNQKRMEESIKSFKEDTEFRFKELTNGGVIQPTRSVDSRIPGSVYDSARDVRNSGGGFVTTLTPAEAELLLEEEKVPQEIITDPPAPIGNVLSQSIDTLDEGEILLSDGSPEEQYREAFSYMQKGNYEGAEKAFTEFLVKFENDDLSGNAQYWLGESYYARKHFPRAAEAFLVGLQKYSESPKGPDSLLKLGMSLTSMGQEQEACAAFGEIELRYQNLSRTLSRRLNREIERLGC